MIRLRALVAASTLLAAGTTPALAADRTIGVGSFDRLRIEAPVEVRVVTGGSPGATISGDDAGIDLRQNGTSIAVARRAGSWQERPRGGNPGPTTVTLTTATLVGATLIGGGRLAVDRMKGARIDLSVSGSGTATIGTIDADQLTVRLIGNGGITLSGGRAGTARMTINGPGAIDAAAVTAGELLVAQDGPGETRARARYVATIANTGIGRVSVAGQPRCVIRAAAGPVACGDTATR